jgi:5-methylcytosine-specific restriction endonuclease McrA
LQIGGFEVDHVVPSSRGGLTTFENLAYACPHCNDRKWAHVEFEDPETGQIVPLFHPRKDSWQDHFRWSSHTDLEVIGTTASGRATVACLQLNHPELTSIRRELRKLGVFAVF